MKRLENIEREFSDVNKDTNKRNSDLEKKKIIGPIEKLVINKRSLKKRISIYIILPLFVSALAILVIIVIANRTANEANDLSKSTTTIIQNKTSQPLSPINKLPKKPNAKETVSNEKTSSRPEIQQQNQVKKPVEKLPGDAMPNEGITLKTNSENKILEDVLLLIRETKFQTKISCTNDRTEFNIGEIIDFSIYSEREGYLTIFDVNSDKEFTLLFPNYSEQNNFIPLGIKKIPGDSYDNFKYEIIPPIGIDTVVAIVTSRFIDFTGIHYWNAKEVFKKLTDGEVQNLGTTLRGIRVRPRESQGKENPLVWSATRIEFKTKQNIQ